MPVRRVSMNAFGVGVAAQQRHHLAGLAPRVLIFATRMAPAPRPRNVLLGTISMPSRASTTLMPLNSTARLAVAPAAPIARILAVDER